MNPDGNINRVVDLLQAVEASELEKLRSLSLQKKLLFEKVEALRADRFAEMVEMAVENTQIDWKNREARRRWFDGSLLDAGTSLAELAAKVESQKIAAARALGQQAAFSKLIEPRKSDRS